MDFLKKMWSNVTAFFDYLGLISRIRKLVNSFPGVDSEEELRLWIIRGADEFVPVVSSTNTAIDDKIVEWIKRIALNKNAFTAIYNLALVAYEKVTPETVYGGGSGVVWDVIAADTDAEPGDVISIIMAISAIVQIISLIREIRKQRGES